MVKDVFGSSVTVLQDPFHVVQRFTEKVKDKGAKKHLAKQLHEVLYTVDEHLRDPSNMATRVQEAVSSVSLNDIKCSERDWRGTLNSNLDQIRIGDLYVEAHTYEEGGGKSTRVLSTSQLEGFHSALKKRLARSVSAEVGLRILDMYIVKHNLRVGSKYGRNPPLEHADLEMLTQTASLFRGAVSETPQLEYVSKLLSAPLSAPQYRSITDHDFGFEQWGQLFETARIDTSALDLNLHRAQDHSASIKELLTKQTVFSSTSRLPKAAFFNSLRLSELEYEAAAGFSAEELALLKLLRSEQAGSGQSWADCKLVTTIMFNIAVTFNSNKQLKLRRCSYASLAARVDALGKRNAATETKSSAASTRQFFKFAIQEPTNDALTGYEQAFQIDIFAVLRELNGVGKKRQLIAKVYDFASYVCSGVAPKTTSNVLARWESLKRASNRSSSLKIKLKIPADMLSSVRESSSDGELSSRATVACGIRAEDELNSLHQSVAENAMVRGLPAGFALPSTTALESPDPNTSNANPVQSPCSSNLIHTNSLQRHNNPDPNPSSTNTLYASGNQCPPSLQHGSNSRGVSSSPTFIIQEHIDRLRKLESELPNRSGKWNRIYREYVDLYPDPDSQISLNALRCRLRPATSSRRKPATDNPTNIAPPSRKRKETSCARCHEKKKGCGDRSVNPQCMRVRSASFESHKLEQLFSLQ